MKRRSHAAGEALGPRQQCLMRPHHSLNSLIESTKVWCAARCALLPRYFANYFTAYDRQTIQKQECKNTLSRFRIGAQSLVHSCRAKLRSKITRSGNLREYIKRNNVHQALPESGGGPCLNDLGLHSVLWGYGIYTIGIG